MIDDAVNAKLSTIHTPSSPAAKKGELGKDSVTTSKRPRNEDEEIASEKSPVIQVTYKRQKKAKPAVAEKEVEVNVDKEIEKSVEKVTAEEVTTSESETI